MHILYLHQYFSTPDGATGTRSYEMARRLVSRGHQVTMVCGSQDAGSSGLTTAFKRGLRRGMVDGIDVVEFDLAYSNSNGFLRRTSVFLKFALRSTKVALTSKCDIIFATTTPLTAGIAGIVVRWLRGTPFVFEVRDLWPELPRKMGVIRNPAVLALMSLLEWCSYRSAHRCVALAPGILEGIVRRGTRRDTIALIPNGCDIDLFAERQRPWRPESVSTNEFMAIFAGAHGIANGLDIVLDAARVLKLHGRTDIKIVLIGRGKLKSQLRARAEKEGLDNVIFHEAVSKRELSGLMAAADLGLQVLANVPAFYFGTSPNKFFDYIAAGLPVLNNYPGWLAELIETHACGFVVPPGNAEAFAAALETAADDRDASRAMGLRAQALARREFARDVLGDRWVEWVTGAASAHVAPFPTRDAGETVMQTEGHEHATAGKGRGIME